MIKLLQISVVVGLTLVIPAWADPIPADDLVIVHCSLPGQIRQLGQRTTYVSPRRPTRTTALDCRVRGGEYVLQDAANTKTALSVWLESAKAGNAQAQTILGEVFEQGVGVPPDYVAAAGWYTLAAEQSYTRALINLGNLYEKGLGVRVDPDKALELYREASGLAGMVYFEPTRDVAPLQSAARREMQETQHKVSQLESERDDMSRSLKKVKAQLAQSVLKADEAVSQTRHIEHLQLQLNEQLKAFQLKEQTLALVQLEADQLANEIDRLRKEQAFVAPQAEMLVQRALPGPTITLVDPVLPSTRGLVKVAIPSGSSVTPVQTVIGRVTAPAGLLALSVNGQAVKANEAGVFTYDLQAHERLADVVVTAVDQQGKRGELLFQMQNDNAVSENSGPRRPKVELGNFYALLIGNSKYEHLPELTTPREDVTRLREVLEGRYGFDVTLLENATRYEILSALNELRARLTSDDNLLVFYAGHGELDRTNMRGHWLPVDAEIDNTANWVSNVAITDIINVMNARQIMLVVDSCYSGTLTRSSIVQLDGGLTDAERETWLKLLAQKRARVVLTSGGLTPVLDVGGGRHSVFANSLITVLDSNEDLLTGRSLYQAVAARVAHAASQYDFEQIPQYAPIARAGHEAGDFFLQPVTESR